MLFALARTVRSCFGTFHLQFKANPVLCRFTQPGATITVRYSAFSNDPNVCDEQYRGQGDQQRNQKVWGRVRDPKIIVKSRWVYGLVRGRVMSFLVPPEKNWLMVLEKIVATADTCLRKRFSLKGRHEACCSHIYFLVLYQLSVLPLVYLSKLRKSSVPVRLGQTSSFNATFTLSKDLQPLPFRKQTRCTEYGK